jgi:hypothetical protein
MGNKKQTAVQWLFEQVINSDWKYMVGEKKQEIFQQAIEMDKAQKIDAYHTAQIEMIESLKEHGLFIGNHNREDKTDAEKWYQKVYGTKQGNIED